MVMNPVRLDELRRRARDGELSEADALELRAAADRVLVGDGGRWMFLRWGEVRLSVVYPVLLAGPESGNAFALMHACALALTKEGQRVPVSMSEFGRRLGFSRPALSRAVTSLIALEVLQFPVRVGRSQTFEMDARLVTHMEEADRKAAAASQAARRELAKRAELVAEKATKRKRAELRVVTPDEGFTEDDRQPELL